MGKDLTLPKREGTFDPIDHGLAGGLECVQRQPHCPALFLIGLDIAEFDLQVFRTAAKHRPHGLDLFGIQIRKDRIAESGLRVIPGIHGLSIFRLESFIERPDQTGMWMHGRVLVL